MESLGRKAAQTRVLPMLCRAEGQYQDLEGSQSSIDVADRRCDFVSVTAEYNAPSASRGLKR